MEATGGSSANSSSSSNSNNNRRFRVQFSASDFIRSPVHTLLEYSGLLRPSHRSSTHQLHESDSLLSTTHPSSPSVSPSTGAEVSIRIIGAGDQDHDRNRLSTSLSSSSPITNVTASEQSRETVCPAGGAASSSSHLPVSAEFGVQDELRGESVSANGGSQSSIDSSSADNEAADSAGATNSNRDSNYQRYDIQQAARWIEQVLPFFLLLLIVFIRQHLQGFFVTIWIAVVMFKSNDILKKHTALKGERKISILIGYCIMFAMHVIGVYWWYRNDDLLHPLVMLPPKAIPPFWHAIFVIMVNDTLVRQTAMVFKCLLLMYFKNSRGRNYRRQGQILTLVEYLVLLYRALLPTPVWYRFFLNKEYGSLFSSLMTGLYLTFKLTSVVEKVQAFFTAVKALSRKEVHYGAYATTEQVSAAGDMCAICQEKMHTPVLLRCKHIFCEDCVSEWFERERTCPLCRALVKPADLKSFADGSTRIK
ncbi:hypothetical protein V2J09_012182 [Rumex salicifolius]